MHSRHSATETDISSSSSGEQKEEVEFRLALTPQPANPRPATTGAIPDAVTSETLATIFNGLNAQGPAQYIEIPNKAVLEDKQVESLRKDLQRSLGQRLKVTYVVGEYLGFRMDSKSHEVGAGLIVKAVEKAIPERLEPFYSPLGGGRHRFNLPNGSLAAYKEADGGLLPDPLDGSPLPAIARDCPSFVVEVGRSDKEGKIRRDALTWLAYRRGEHAVFHPRIAITLDIRDSSLHLSPAHSHPPTLVLHVLARDDSPFPPELRSGRLLSETNDYATAKVTVLHRLEWIPNRDNPLDHDLLVPLHLFFFDDFRQVGPLPPHITNKIHRDELLTIRGSMLHKMGLKVWALRDAEKRDGS